MKKNFIKYSVIALITLILLALVDASSRYLLPEKMRSPLIYNPATDDSDPYAELHGVGFDQIDPLTGWYMSDSLLHSKAFHTESRAIVMQTRYQEDKPLLIYLSGGSTTDPAVVPENWPQHLVTLLDSAHVCAKVVIGAVGGYNSGQELLRYMSRDFTLHPDIFISYSGANEWQPSYVSLMEQGLYNEAAHPHYRLMPNTITYIRWKMHVTHTGIDLKVIDYFDSLKPAYYAPDPAAYSSFVSGFWLRNMLAMHAIAASEGHAFIGILQPVQGGSSYTQHNDRSYAEDLIKDYKRYYPGLRTVARDHTDFLADFTTMFDDVKDQVYYDDCHIKKEVYEKMIARKIFALMAERDLLQSKNISPKGK